MQRVTIVRYKVKPEAAAQNEQLSHAVFDRVRQDQPRGISYGLFKEEDGQSFIHVFVNLLDDIRMQSPACPNSRPSVRTSAHAARFRPTSCVEA